MSLRSTFVRRQPLPGLTASRKHAPNLANSSLHASLLISVYVASIHLPYSVACAAQVTVECKASLFSGVVVGEVTGVDMLVKGVARCLGGVEEQAYFPCRAPPRWYSTELEVGARVGAPDATIAR